MIFGAFLVAAFFGCILRRPPRREEFYTPPTSRPGTPTPQAHHRSQGGYYMPDVRRQHTQSDCWPGHHRVPSAYDWNRQFPPRRVHSDGFRERSPHKDPTQRRRGENDAWQSHNREGKHRSRGNVDDHNPSASPVRRPSRTHNKTSSRNDNGSNPGTTRNRPPTRRGSENKKSNDADIDTSTASTKKKKKKKKDVKPREENYDDQARHRGQDQDHEEREDENKEESGTHDTGKPENTHHSAREDGEERVELEQRQGFQQANVESVEDEDRGTGW